MKIYFGASTSQWKKYSDNYKNIRNILINEGCLLTRDWIGMYQEVLDNSPKQLDREKSVLENTYQKIIKAFYSAEIFIAENTVSSFSIGHLMTLAAQRNMPTLILINKEKPKRYLKNSFIEGIAYPNLEVLEYDNSTLEQQLKTFLHKYQNSNTRHRFNLVIDDVEKRYLEWAKYNKQRSRTNLIRDFIREAINKDSEYSKYLAK